MKKMEFNLNESKRDLQLKENLQKIKKKIMVLSGKGGVGKSTVSVNIAYGFALKGFKTGILDVDVHGPSIAKMLGIEGKVLNEFSDDGRPLPIKVNENLRAFTIASLLKNPDDPLIWRGPLITGAIKQFLSDISWPELEYLVIDSPPGTGDEPLTVHQLMGYLDGAIIVTTPQDIALIDVKRTIRFCQELNIPIIGVIENMGAFKCPHCGNWINIFPGEGAKKLEKEYGVEILGSIPVDPDIVNSTDKGVPFIYHYSKTEAGKVYQEIVDKIVDKV